MQPEKPRLFRAICAALTTEPGAWVAPKTQAEAERDSGRIDPTDERKKNPGNRSKKKPPMPENTSRRQPTALHTEKRVVVRPFIVRLLGNMFQTLNNKRDVRFVY